MKKKIKVVVGTCTNCGSVTGTVAIKTQEFMKPVKTEKRCNHCNPELFYNK